MGIAENNLVEVPNVEGDLLTHILSPMLSNIMLNELDKELTKRGHPFVRYADDCMIFCRSERAAGRILESISKFIEGKLFLKVNRDKTDTGSVCVYGKAGRIQGRG
jgi:retron-type reverse transcriptase